MEKENTLEFLPKLKKTFSDSVFVKRNAFQSLIRIDKVRISKLFELVQNGIVIFALAFFIGSFVDKIFIVTRKDDEISNSRLILEVLAQFVVIIILAYYIGKVADAIPFFFSLTSEYQSNMKGEAGSSAGLAMAIIFVGIQKNFGYKIGLLRKRYAFNE